MLSPNDMLWQLLFRFFIAVVLVFATVGLAAGVGLIERDHVGGERARAGDGGADLRREQQRARRRGEFPGQVIRTHVVLP